MAVSERTRNPFILIVPSSLRVIPLIRSVALEVIDDPIAASVSTDSNHVSSTSVPSVLVDTPFII